MTTEAERRHICRLIDMAVERCEERNLRERLEVPRCVAELVVQLQAGARRPLSVPRDTITAHGQLLDLREGYMNRREEADEELEQEPDEDQRDDNLCASCGSPLSPLSRYSTCSHCRQLQRRVARLAEVLAS